TLLRLTTQLIFAAAAGIATLWGHMATRLYLYPEPFLVTTAFAHPRRTIHLSYILYLIPMVLTIAVGWGDAGSIDADPSRMALYLLDGTEYRSVGYSSLFIAVAATLAAAFISYPFLVLTHLRAQLRDREVRYALKVFASCFGAIATLLLIINALSSFGYSIQGPGHLVSVILLIIAVRSFRRPTFLKAFLGVVPSLEFSPTTTQSDQMVLIYRGEEKFGPLSRYLIQGTNAKNRVVYFHQGDEAITREELDRHGVNVRRHLLNGNLRLFPFGSLYRTEGLLDEEAALDFHRELTSEARTLGKDGLRVIIDYGDHVNQPSQKFVEHLTDARWNSPDHYVHVLMAFTNTAFHGHEAALAQLRSKMAVLDLSESLDVFSRTVGLSHSEIGGSKILLEFDPLSDYERLLKAIVAEATSNFERIAVFTRRDSPIHSLIRVEPSLKMFVLTSRVSYPKVERENRVLLPAYDSSLLLDAMNKTIEAYASAPSTVIFDNITHYIFTLGPERAHSLVRQAL
ncbi:MAG: MEDS domain-containing protein, partial [Nitrososphaera sp.]